VKTIAILAFFGAFGLLVVDLPFWRMAVALVMLGISPLVYALTKDEDE
jgi:hypothetical protein